MKQLSLWNGQIGSRCHREHYHQQKIANNFSKVKTTEATLKFYFRKIIFTMNSTMPILFTFVKVNISDKKYVFANPSFD